jgi:GntR family histidine utilization transcriptional repressor
MSSNAAAPVAPDGHPGRLPAYGQVKAFIQSRISSGTWKPGDPVPSEAALGARFGVSRMTVNRALRELTDQGLVRRVQGSGSFVAELDRISSTLRLRDIHEEVLERGHLHATRVLKVESLRASPEVARTLGLRANAKTFHTVLIHLENGLPIQYEDRYVNPAAAPRYLDEDFNRTTPTHHLLAHAPLTEASYSVEACLPSVDEARHLEIRRGEPCLVMVRRTVSGARVASIARQVYPGSRYSFSGQFQA